MSRAALLLGVLGALVAVPAAKAACPAPRHLAFSLNPGAAAGRLSWHPARHVARGMRYRVSRDNRAVGQTSRSHMRVRVRPGRTYWFFVRPVTKRGRPMLCWSQLRYRVR